MLLAGLDIETTGLDKNAGHRLIQIGIAVLDTDAGTYSEYSSDVRPIGKMAIDPEALGVNKFTKKRIKAAPSQDSVDAMLFNELFRGGYHLHTLIAVGWNVVAFDMPFIQKELPLVYNFFNRPTSSTRAIDLTGIGHLLAYQTGKDYDTVKREVRAEAAKRLGGDNQHDALYDAKAAIEAFRIFNELLGIKL